MKTEILVIIQTTKKTISLEKNKLHLSFIENLEYTIRFGEYFSIVVISVFLLSFSLIPIQAIAESNSKNLSTNGTLHRSIPIGGLPFGPLELQHSTDFKGRGPHSVVSDWRVPALFTYAGPEGRRHVVWVRPGGSVERFANNRVLRRAPDLLTETWTAVSDGAEENRDRKRD